MKRPVVRNTRPEDIPALIALQRRVYPHIPSWSRRDLGHQLEVFPQGQLVVEYDGRVCGCASSLIVLWDDWSGEHTWKEVTASGTFDSHNPDGRTLYGAEVFVDPSLQGVGLGQALYEGRRAICRQSNLKRIIACGRLPGYGRHADQMSPELYAKKVVWGDLRDPVLGFQLRQGFSYCGVIENYIPEDEDSHGHASLIVWLNPDYDPQRPTLVPKEIKL